jgi:hypothetical protein
MCCFADSIWAVSNAIRFLASAMLGFTSSWLSGSGNGSIIDGITIPCTQAALGTEKIESPRRWVMGSVRQTSVVIESRRIGLQPFHVSLVFDLNDANRANPPPTL